MTNYMCVYSYDSVRGEELLRKKRKSGGASKLVLNVRHDLRLKN